MLQLLEKLHFLKKSQKKRKIRFLMERVNFQVIEKMAGKICQTKTLQ